MSKPTCPRPSRRSLLAMLLLPLAVLASPVLAQTSFGPSVVEAGFNDPDAAPFDGRLVRCAGVVEETGTELALHCGHDFQGPITLEVLRADGTQVARLDDQGSDIAFTLELDAPTRRDLNRGEIDLRATGDDRSISGRLSPPAPATGSSVRLEVALLDDRGREGGSCTAVLLGIGTRLFLFDLYLDCVHDLGGDASAGLFDRTPGSALASGPDGLLADLGDGLAPVLLDWRISDEGTSPVGGFFGGTFEIVVTGAERQLRAMLDGCLAGGDSVCLHRRFQASASYLENVTGERLRVSARPVSFSLGAALFSFTDPEQVEVVLNLEDRCAETGFFELRASAMSEQRPRLAITDTVTGEEKVVKLYRIGGGKAGKPLSVIDEAAFPCD